NVEDLVHVLCICMSHKNKQDVGILKRSQSCGCRWIHVKEIEEAVLTLWVEPTTPRFEEWTSLTTTRIGSVLTLWLVGTWECIATVTQSQVQAQAQTQARPYRVYPCRFRPIASIDASCGKHGHSIRKPGA